MANEEHLAWLAGGAEAWNRRRREQPFKPDLVGADLARRSLHRFNLRDADLRRADLHSANLQGADLEQADLTQANLYRADLRGARLERAVVNRATLKRGKLDRCDLRGAQLYGADLSHARFDEADLRGADLRAWLAVRQDEPRNEFEAMFRKKPVAIVTITAGQLRSAAGDGATLLPDAVERPTHWEASPPPARPTLKATPAAEFDWREDGRLGATRLHPVPPRPRSGETPPLDPMARDQQLATLARLAERLATSIEGYAEEGGHNRGFVARSLGPALRTIAEECDQPAEAVLIAFVRANIAALERLKGEEAEALADIDRALFEQLFVEWRRLTPFFPVLAEIDSPANATVAPNGSESDADQFVFDVMKTVTSDAAREILSEETLEVFKAERDKPTSADAEGQKERLVRFAALAATLGRALDDAPKPVKRVAAFTGFVLTVKELVQTVLWIF